VTLLIFLDVAVFPISLGVAVFLPISLGVAVFLPIFLDVAVFLPIDKLGIGFIFENELLANEEDHNSNLSDGIEAPDGGLLVEVGRDPSREDGSREEEEEALNPHVLFEDEEGAKHEEGVEGNPGREVGGFVHGHAPGEVIEPRISA